MLGNNFKKLKIKKNNKGFTQHHFYSRWMSLSVKKSKDGVGLTRTRGGAGFTLMEILVVVAIFSVMVMVISDVYLLTLGAQRQTTFRQKTLSNVRYVLENMARQVRVSEISYIDQIVNPESKLDLRTQDGQRYLYKLTGNKILLEVYGECSEKKSPCITDDTCPSGQTCDYKTYALTNSEELDVINLDFYINPETDPFDLTKGRCNDNSDCSSGSSCSVDESGNPFELGFCGCDKDLDCEETGYCDPDDKICLPPNGQPRVTIAIGFKSKGVKADEEKVIFLQTTVSSRIYKR